jgi:hypothetical protein
MTRPTARLAVALVALGLGSGATCESFARNHPITLDSEVFSFHKALADRRYAEAARHMDPALRQPFVEQWLRADQYADIQAVDVTSVDKTPDLEFAHVTAVVGYADRNTLVVREHRLHELWKADGATWTISAAIPPPPVAGLVTPQPTLPLAPLPAPAPSLPESNPPRE